MKFLTALLVFLLTEIAFAKTDISVPVTVTAGTTTTNSFTIPSNKTGTWLITIPCDPAWQFAVAIQESADKGTTWNCQNTPASKCPGFEREARACIDNKGNPLANITVAWAQKDDKGQDVPKAQNVMRLIITSNIAKTMQVTASFDPQL